MRKTQVRNAAGDLPQGRVCPALFHPELTRQALATAVPRPCQNERETAVISGRSRTPRTASDLAMGWLTCWVKHTSKQPLTYLGYVANRIKQLTRVAFAVSRVEYGKWRKVSSAAEVAERLLC